MNEDRDRAEAIRSATPWLYAVLPRLVASLVAMGTCAASAGVETRRQTGERYAREFSDPSHGRRVTWDDGACSFTESVTLADALSGPPATRVTVIPAARTGASVLSRGASPGMLDVLFRCAGPPLRCIERARRVGTRLTKDEPVGEHTIALPATLAALPRISSDLDGLHKACVPTESDGGR